MREYTEHQRRYNLSETPLHLQIRDALAETTERAQAAGIPLYLTGGISASLLSGEQWRQEDRPLSADLDFLVPSDAQSLTYMEEVFQGAFVHNTGKPVFKSYKMQSKASNGIELDFIAQSNIVHPDAQLSVSITPFVTAHARTEQFLGANVQTLPPELVVIQKLFAGRGIDIGKYDLADAAAIIRGGHVDRSLFMQYAHELTAKAHGRSAALRKLRTSLSKLGEPGAASLMEALDDLDTQTFSLYSQPVRNNLSQMNIL